MSVSRKPRKRSASQRSMARTPIVLFVGVALIALIVYAVQPWRAKVAAIVSNTAAPEAGTTNTPAIAAKPDPSQKLLDALANRVDSLFRDTSSRMTREQLQASLETFRSDAQALKDARGQTDQWKQVVAQIDELAKRLPTLPSERPDESIYQPILATSAWQAPAARGEETSVGPFNLRLPADARLDLQSSITSPQGITWRWKNTWASMSIKYFAALDSRQRQPWIAPAWITQRSPVARNAFVIEMDQAKLETGTLAGEPWIRAESTDAGRARIVYAALVDQRWLVAEIAPGTAADALTAFDAAIKTFRRRLPDEARSDPFAPEKLVLRLEDAPVQSAALLRRAGPAGEEALIGVLNANDSRMQRALSILSDTATARSLPAMRKLAESSDRAIAQTSRNILRRLAPQEFDEFGIAALALKDASSSDRATALQLLAKGPRDPKRPQITRAIEQIVLSEDEELRADATAALVTWADELTVPKFAPWLDENASETRRQTAMAVLPATKDRRAVYPIARWLIKQSDEAVAALIALGPVAEEEMIKLLNERDAEIRRNAARVLHEIGTGKSILGLQRASTDARDAGAAAAAKTSLTAVRDRVKETQLLRAPATRP